MEGFKPQAASVPPAENSPNRAGVEAHRELKSIVGSTLEKASEELTPEERILVFKRMRIGPTFKLGNELVAINDNVFPHVEDTSENKETFVVESETAEENMSEKEKKTEKFKRLFGQISAVEEKYGRDIVAELAVLYGADRV